jgi:hypothetical protein
MRNPRHNDSFGKLILRVTVGPLMIILGIYSRLAAFLYSAT